MAGGEEALHPILFGGQDGFHGGWNQDMRRQDRKIIDVLLPRLEDGHGIGRSGGFKSDREKDDFLMGIFFGQL